MAEIVFLANDLYRNQGTQRRIEQLAAFSQVQINQAAAGPVEHVEYDNVVCPSRNRIRNGRHGGFHQRVDSSLGVARGDRLLLMLAPWPGEGHYRDGADTDADRMPSRGSAEPIR